MFRLIGFLLGVVITVVALAVVVDAPTRERAGALATELTAAIFDAVERLRTTHDVGGDGAGAEPEGASNTTRVDSADPAPIEEAQPSETDVSHDTQTQTDGPAATDATPASSPEPIAHSERPPERQKNPASGSFAAPEKSADSANAELNWEPVWRAFRSELSAKGFAGRLKHLTGEEYRVRRTSPWTYQVELPYVDEEQRDEVLNEIQSKTGLILMESRP